MNLFNSVNITVDDNGEECVVLRHRIDDDILKDIDMEKSIGSAIMNRLHYKIDKETVNVKYDSYN